MAGRTVGSFKCWISEVKAWISDTFSPVELVLLAIISVCEAALLVLLVLLVKDRINN